MGNSASRKKPGSYRSKNRSDLKTPNKSPSKRNIKNESRASSTKNVRIDPNAINGSNKNSNTQSNSKTKTQSQTGGGGKGKGMDKSAEVTNSSGNRNRGSDAPIMITDALSDVRVNYHIDPKELGHGHYGVVRQCMNRETEEWFAIKSIRKSKVSKIEVLKREIQILMEVKHPHIIELVEVFEDERYLHLITELCTGGELFDRIIAKTQTDDGHFSEHDAAVLVRDILDAIQYCHEKGIVHRDLKPENFLFLTEADNSPVKIIDFGLSRHDDTNSGIMQTKVGTPYYVAPEVLRREYTKSCDIWSIGVITYILLCGYPPFYGDSDTQIFESVRTGKFDFPSPEWDEISDSAKDLVVALLMKDSNQRPTAGDALKMSWFEEQLGAKNKRRGVSRSISHTSGRTETFTKYLAMKKLKKAALNCIASNLTHAEVGALDEIFKKMDKAGTGKIAIADVDEAIAKGNTNEQAIQDLRSMRRRLSLADNEKIDYRGFVAMTMDRSVAMQEDNVKMAFEHFRRSGADYLTMSDLAEIFGGEARAQDVLSILDMDGDGKVSYEDFRHAVVESMEESCHNDDDLTPI